MMNKIKLTSTAIFLFTLAAVFSACGGTGGSDGGNGNTSDPNALTLTISSSEENPTSAVTIPVTFTFSDDVTGFKAGDVTVTNGRMIGFTAESSSVYRANITPDEEGAVRVSVAANAAQGSYSNGNAAAKLTITYNTDVIIKTYISDISATTSAITLSWSDPLDINFNHVAITSEYKTNSETRTVAAGTGAFTLSSINGTPLSPNTLYKITVKSVSSAGGLSKANVFLIKTSSSGAIEYTVISSADELYYIRDLNLGGNYLLAADIDLSEYSLWTPLGNESSPFTGIFNGNGHTISNLTIQSTAGYQGLFGFVKGGSVCGLGLIDVNVSGGEFYVGGLAGRSQDNTISNCHVTGVVSGIYYVGGLLGYSAENTIYGCYTACTVTSNPVDVGFVTGVGGLIGYNKNSAVSNCYATGPVTGSSFRAGGLIGAQVDEDEDKHLSIVNCYATGSVSGKGLIGGLVGQLWGSRTDISNCYATGAVSGTHSNIAGLVGQYWSYYGIISYCYATGTVSNGSGGLVGDYLSAESSVSNSFYDSTTTGMSGTGRGTPMTTAEMLTVTTFTNAGWDFSGETTNGLNDYWDIDSAVNGGYPYLTGLAESY